MAMKFPLRQRIQSQRNGLGSLLESYRERLLTYKLHCFTEDSSGKCGLSVEVYFGRGKKSNHVL